MPVRLPPGRARLATRPVATGSPTPEKTIVIVWVALFAASGHAVAAPPRRVMSSRRLMLGLSIRWRASNMAQQSRLRYAGRIAVFHPHEPIGVPAANDGKGGKSCRSNSVVITVAQGLK